MNQSINTDSKNSKEAAFAAGLSKLPNFISKSTDLVQLPTWINPEVKWLSKSWLI